VCVTPTLNAALCDPERVSFTLASTNRHFPLEPGSVAILEGIEGGVMVRVERRVLGEIQDVLGVTTRVLEQRTFLDGVLREVARKLHAEAMDGTVCYFGQDVEIHENGLVVGNEGTWRAGRDDARPGIAMPATPQVGNVYTQASAADVEVRQGRVSAVGETRTFAGTSYDDVVTIADLDALGGGATCAEEQTQYAPGVGEAQAAEKTLVMFTPPPPPERR
jgi:hypothetical protein